MQVVHAGGHLVHYFWVERQLACERAAEVFYSFVRSYAPDCLAVAQFQAVAAQFPVDYADRCALLRVDFEAYLLEVRLDELDCAHRTVWFLGGY